MLATIDSTNQRRMKQMAYNELHGIVPQALNKQITNVLANVEKQAYVEPEGIDVAADPVVQYMKPEALKKSIDNNRKLMQKAAKELDFITAAQYRDEIRRLEALLGTKTT